MSATDNNLTIKATNIKTLTQATDSINKSLTKGKSAVFEIAITLQRVADGKLLENTEYNNISDYGYKVFGFKRASVNNMVRVARRFLTTVNGKVDFVPLLGDNVFSESQLQEMLSLTEDAHITELLESGINDSSRTKEIREAVIEVKKKHPDVYKTEETSEETSEETTEESTEVVNDVENNVAFAKDMSIQKIIQGLNDLEKYVTDDVISDNLFDTEKVSTRTMLNQIKESFNHLLDAMKQ